MAGTPSQYLLNSLAGIVILGFVAVTGFSLWLVMDSRDQFGPTALVTGGDGHVFLNIGPVLYELDARGRLLERVPLAELGIEGRHLTDLLVLDDGTLLVGATAGPDIRACRLRERRCAGWLQDSRRPRSSFKMVRDAARDRLLVVDGERHRILGYDDQGHYLDESGGGARGLKYPNTAWLTPADELVVADTNHHRLVALDAETLRRELWELPVENDLGNFRRIWPTDFVHGPAGNYWVILDDDLLEHGDVILYDASHAPLRRVELPADWDPIKMRAREHDVLLAGFGSVDLVTVSADGAAVQPFGDGAVRAELAKTRAVRLRNERWWDRWIWVTLIPLGLLAILVGWQDYRRRGQARTQTAAATPGAGGRDPLADTPDGIYWFTMKPAVAKRLRTVRRMLYILPLLLLAIPLPMLAVCSLQQAVTLAAPLFALTLPVLAMVYTGFRAMTGSRLGVTRDGVVLARGADRYRHFIPQQLVWSRNFVSSGDITVYMRNGWGPLYADTDMQDILRPRLAGARRLNGWQGHMYLLHAGEPLAWATTLGLLCLFGLLLYMQLFMV